MLTTQIVFLGSLFAFFSLTAADNSGVNPANQSISSAYHPPSQSINFNLEVIHFANGTTNPNDYVPYCDAPATIDGSFCYNETTMGAWCSTGKEKKFTVATSAACAPDATCVQVRGLTQRARCIPSSRIGKWSTPADSRFYGAVSVHTNTTSNAMIVNNFYLNHTSPPTIVSSDFIGAGQSIWAGAVFGGVYSQGYFDERPDQFYCCG